MSFLECPGVSRPRSHGQVGFTIPETMLCPEFVSVLMVNHAAVPPVAVVSESSSESPLGPILESLPES